MDESKDRTLWVGNIAEEATDEMLYELFLQAGPIERVAIPKDKTTGKQKNFAFITFKHELSVPFCINIFDGVYLFKRRLQIKTRNGSIHTSGKSPVDPEKWGIGLLPHPSKGVGMVKPQGDVTSFMNKLDQFENGHANSPHHNDFDNNNRDDMKYQSLRRGFNPNNMSDPSYLMPPPGNMQMGSRGSYQGQNTGQRNFHRSQTWAGVMELPENGSDGKDSSLGKHKYDERFDSDNNGSDRRESRDNRDGSSKRRRFEEEPRSRDSGHRNGRGDGPRDRDSGRGRNGGSFDRQRSTEGTTNPVEMQLQQMAQVQMQMLQQQQLQQQMMQNIPNRGRSFLPSSYQYSSSNNYRRY